LKGPFADSSIRVGWQGIGHVRGFVTGDHGEGAVWNGQSHQSGTAAQGSHSRQTHRATHANGTSDQEDMSVCPLVCFGRTGNETRKIDRLITDRRGRNEWQTRGGHGTWTHGNEFGPSRDGGRRVVEVCRAINPAT